MFNIKIVVLLLIGLVELSKSDSIGFTDCGSEYDLVDVNIDGCSKAPCTLYKGTHPHITFKLYANVVSRNLQQFVELVLRGIHVTIDVTPDNPCDEIKCPVSSNHNASFNATLNLDNEYLPQLDGSLKWIIKNDNGLTVMCMKVGVRVKNLRYLQVDDTKHVMTRNENDV